MATATRTGVRVRLRQDVTEDGKIVIKFDREVLDTFIKYILQKYLDKTHFKNMSTLMKALDISAYNYDPDIKDRVLFLLHVSEAKLNNLKETSLLKEYVIKQEESLKNFVNQLNWKVETMSPQEIKFVGNKISSRVQNLYVYLVKDKIINTLQKFDDMEYVSYHDVMLDLRTQITQLLGRIHETDIQERVMRSFNFTSPEFTEKIDQIVTKSKEPYSMLQTGMRQLNAILSGGFQGTRLYTILGLSGKFKSGTLLNVADQIRRFNPQVVKRDDGGKNVILFVTCENTIEETIERLFDMYAEGDETLQNLTPEEVINIIRTRGGYNYDTGEGIDIEFRFFSDLEIDTGELAALIQSQEDIGRHVIALILDYLALVDCVRDVKAGDERTRLKYVTKEIKNIALAFRIPIITAQQVNRDGNTAVDNATRDNKNDVARYVGVGNVAESWSIVEKSDWVILVNPEYRKSDNKLYLTFKLLKRRGKKKNDAIDYFNQPFVNEKNIRLVTDVDKPYSAAVISLNSDIDEGDLKAIEATRATQQRPMMTVVKGMKVNDLSQLKAAG